MNLSPKASRWLTTLPVVLLLAVVVGLWATASPAGAQPRGPRERDEAREHERFEAERRELHERRERMRREMQEIEERLHHLEPRERDEPHDRDRHVWGGHEEHVDHHDEGWEGHFERLEMEHAEVKVALAHAELRAMELENIRGMMEMIHAFTEIAEDPQRAAVAAIFVTREHAESPHQAAGLLERALEEQDDPTVRRAIRLTLLTLYADIDEGERALPHLKALVMDDDDDE